MLMKSLGIQNLSLVCGKFHFLKLILKYIYSVRKILVDSEDIEYIALSEDRRNMNN